MTKPNDFTLNTDYLALAQTDKTEFTVYFPAETFSPGYAHDRTQDFRVPYSKGAIDMFLMSLNGGTYVLGAEIIASTTSPSLIFYVSRINPQTIRVRLHEFTSQSGGYSMPMQTVKVKVCSFKPPDTF